MRNSLVCPKCDSRQFYDVNPTQMPDHRAANTVVELTLASSITARQAQADSLVRESFTVVSTRR